jgi:hypothetical protein
MPQVTAASLTYAGAFKLGLDSQTSFGAGDNFDSTTGAIAFNPANGNMFIAGGGYIANSAGQKIGEFPIPALVLGTNIAALNEIKRADAVQSFTDPTNGLNVNILTPPGYDTQGNYIRGMHVHNGQLLVNYDGFYTTGQQTYSVFRRSTNLASNVGLVGPARITVKPRMAAGSFSDVPAAVQAAHGIKPVVVTQPLGSIQTELSYGKPVAAFDPADIATSADVVEQVLVQYNRVGFTNVGTEPYLLGGSVATAPSSVETQNDYYNLSTKIKGVVWPDGYDSVLVFAYTGTGPYWYGPGDGSHPSGQVDPHNNNAQLAPHAPPYSLRCYVYNAQDLIDVKNGIKAADSFLPMTYFDLADPFERADSYNASGGVTYDRANRRIYISRAGQNYYPGITSTGVILAFDLAAPAASPTITSLGNASGQHGVSGSHQAIASGGTPPYTWALSSAPAGVTINPSTGLISWTAGVP